jgi:hypothetical protein
MITTKRYNNKKLMPKEDGSGPYDMGPTDLGPTDLAPTEMEETNI